MCGDTGGLTATGDIFVACNECAFPVCRPCYEYERRDGNKTARSARLDIKDTKGVLELTMMMMRMRMRMRMMTWRMSSIMHEETTRRDASGKMLISLLPLDMKL